MTGLWLVSYIVLWLIAIGEGLVILALAREIEELHKRLDSLNHHLALNDTDNQLINHDLEKST